MKKLRIPGFVLMLSIILLLASCEQITSFIESRTRPLQLIEIYNGHLEKTLKMMPNDTMYVKVQGLSADTEYLIQCIDPDDAVITEIQTKSDDTGVIDPSPIWFDVGFKKDANGRPYLDTSDELMLRAFNVKVQSLGSDGLADGNTNVKLPFFFVNSTVLARPQPIVMAGKVESGQFYVENAFYSENALNTGADADHPGPDTLYVKVYNMENLARATGTDTARVYIVPFNGEPYETGADVAENAWFYQDCSLTDLTSATGAKIQWPNATNADLIPVKAEGTAFSVILDVGSKQSDGTIKYGTYDILKEGTTDYYLDGIDGNGIPGFIVKKPPVPPSAVYVPLNLASGGVFGWTYESGYGWKMSYDYRDTFNKSGYDTRYASHSGEFWGYGVKVIWNPYQSLSSWPSGFAMPSNFWGKTVDVYVVNSSQSLLKDATIVPAAGTSKKTLPVQYGCANGYWQQTIWRAPLTPGSYMLVVDMNRDGKISDYDLVDDQHTNDTAWTSGSDKIGFEVK